MQNNTFSKLLHQLKFLTPFQKEQVEETLHHTDAIDTLSKAIEAPKSCPHCSSTLSQMGNA